MEISKPNKLQKPKDISNLLSEVASFASSIGLSSSLPSSGFNDSDFRITGPLKPHKPSTANREHGKNKPNNNNHKNENKPKSRVLPRSKKNKPNNSRVSPSQTKPLPKLPLMKAASLAVWYSDAAELEGKVIGDKKLEEIVNVKEWEDVVREKREVGERLLVQYAQDYELSSRRQRGDMKMLYAVQKSGTTQDKTSAYSVLVAENPIANLKSLDSLLDMVASKGGKRYAFMGFDTLKELFIYCLLPDRKLKELKQRPLNNLPESKDGYSLLLFWYWEDCLKSRYKSFISALEEASRDVLHSLKDKALKIMYALLTNKSEEGHRLLSALVNKLGDPGNKTASTANFHLLKLLPIHSNMKALVIDEVDSFLMRPHLGLEAKYQSVNFLNQILLSHRGNGPKVAKRLIDVYFSLFKVLVSEAGVGREMGKSSKAGDGKDFSSSKNTKEKSPSESHVELDSRLVEALLTGVNRAYPFVSNDEADDVIEVQTPMLFQLVHSKNFNVGLQALRLLYKISSKNQIVSDRFYRALYSKLLLPAALNTSKVDMFNELLLRAMKNDINLKRVAAFSKRLLQVALQQPAELACGCLFLLSKVLQARPPLWNMVLQNESVDEDLEHFEDIEDENELSTKKPESDDGFVRKSNIVDSASHSEDFVKGGVELLFRDGSEDLQKSKMESGCDGYSSQVSTLRSLLPGGYNIRHREPSFCNADRVSWWELVILASHVHPSVAAWARTLLCGVPIVYNGNPIHDLSLSAFLDKFMEKKAKSSMWHGGSQIKPAKKLDMNNHLTGAEILSLAEVDVPPEDIFFHKFYMNKMSSSKKPKKKKAKQTEDDVVEEFFQADAGDESDNEEIENMLESADPLLEREDGDYDYDALDQVANEDDEDLVGDDSDADMDISFDIDSSDDDVTDAADSSDDKSGPCQKKRKRKSGRKTGVSSFASLEDYEDLLDDNPKKNESKTNMSKEKMRQKKRKPLGRKSYITIPVEFV